MKLALVVLLARGAAAEPTPLRVGLEWFLNPDHLPLVVAQRAGLFADAGLDVELVEPADHWEAEEEIIAGRLDVAVTETLHLAQDAAKGKPVVGFARFLHTDGGVMFLKGRNITRPRDMCGATISYPGFPGPGGPAIVNTMVEADGGHCAEPFGKHDGGFYHTDALLNGADVATLIFYNFEVIEAKSRGLDAGFFSLKDYGVPDFCQLVLFTTPEKLAASTPALRRLVLAVRKATGIIKTDPARARKMWLEHTRTPRPLAARLNPLTLRDRNREIRTAAATFDATLPAFVNDNSLAREYFEALMGWLVKTSQVDAAAAAATDVSKYWTNSIAL
mmetsp:Transcript_19313/g.59437  ORF Transcript_19313/g.59437 Transcript_19313/m.59437 type:complete len:333 (+) Transcript_19313:203-1201(+)